MGFKKFVLFFFSTPLRLILTCQWEMSNAIRRGEDDELKSGRKTAREKWGGKRRKDGLSGGLGALAGPSPAD